LAAILLSFVLVCWLLPSAALAEVSDAPNDSPVETASDQSSGFREDSVAGEIAKETVTGEIPVDESAGDAAEEAIDPEEITAIEKDEFAAEDKEPTADSPAAENPNQPEITALTAPGGRNYPPRDHGRHRCGHNPEYEDHNPDHSSVQYMSRVYIYLEDLGQSAFEEGATGDSGNAPTTLPGYSPAEPAYIDVLFSAGDELLTYNTIIATQQTGFVLNQRLSDATWQDGPGADIVAENPETGAIVWGDTTAGSDRPAKVLTLYYDRKLVSVSFFSNLLAPPETISGQYGAPLFDDENSEYQALLHPTSTEHMTFHGWYLWNFDSYPDYPDYLGNENDDFDGKGIRVDDPQTEGYLATFPAESIFLYAWWVPVVSLPPDDEPEDDEENTGDLSDGSDEPMVAPQSANVDDPPDEGPALEALEEGITISEPAPPLASFGPIDIPLVAAPGEMAFSLASVLFTGLGLGGSTVLMMGFLLRRQSRVSTALGDSSLMLSTGFLLRATALGLGLVQLATCMGTQDLSSPPVVFDVASLPTLLIFVIQALLFATIFLEAHGRSLPLVLAGLTGRAGKSQAEDEAEGSEQTLIGRAEDARQARIRRRY
jgi:hypothetical protein